MKKVPKFSCTLADVAKIAGVSAATVSLALRSDARISAATQARVRRAAKEIGYKPDPMLSALVARKHRFTGHRALANLAVIVDDEWYTLVGTTHWIDTLTEGLHNSCDRYGYHLDILHLHRDLLSSKHPDKMLHSRGIRGLIILPVLNHKFDLHLQWDRYAVIAMGAQSGNHLFHRVATDAFASMSLTCQKLSELGYRRIGLVNDLRTEIRCRYEWIGSLAKEAYMRPQRIEMVPPYIPETFTNEDFIKWVQQYEPECIVSNYPHLYYLLRDAGYKLPDDIGLSILTHSYIPEPLTSISHDLKAGGETSIELLHNMLVRGETGQPETLRETLIYPKWIEGKTTRRLTPERK